MLTYQTILGGGYASEAPPLRRKKNSTQLRRIASHHLIIHIITHILTFMLSPVILQYLIHRPFYRTLKMHDRH